MKFKNEQTIEKINEIKSKVLKNVDVEVINLQLY